MQRSFGDNVDLPAKKVFQVLFQGDVVDKTPSFFHVHEEVKVTFGTVLPSGRRAEETDVAGTVLPGQPEDIVTVMLNCWMHEELP
jgi:hypothetical protein